MKKKEKEKNVFARMILDSWVKVQKYLYVRKVQKKRGLIATGVNLRNKRNAFGSPVLSSSMTPLLVYIFSSESL